MDLNLKRRKRERAIASEVAAEFLREIRSSEQLAPPEILAHHFGRACLRMNVLLTEPEVARIFAYVEKSLARENRKVDRLRAKLNAIEVSRPWF